MMLSGNTELKNIARIDSIKNEAGEITEDRDPEEDFEDYEVVKVKPDFNLALRKFVTQVENMPVNDRYPEVIYKDGAISYDQKKDPVDVQTGNTVVYTLRIFNESEAEGFANEIIDDIPEGLEFIKGNSINEEYKWVMLDENKEVTLDKEEAKYISTDYLSEKDPNNIIKAFDKNAEISDKDPKNPDYKDIKVAFKVTYAPDTDEEDKRIITNTARITKFSDEDKDPTDNEDKDHVIVDYFDLALLKWVESVDIKYSNGKQETITRIHSRNW